MDRDSLSLVSLEPVGCGGGEGKAGEWAHCMKDRHTSPHEGCGVRTPEVYLDNSQVMYVRGEKQVKAMKDESRFLLVGNSTTVN
jgi:hypothetical protein